MSSTPLEIGVTGGIGSGKSLVCKIFSKLGIPVYDADSRAKWLTNNLPKIRQKVTEKFGEQAYNEKGLDRNYIAGLVFNDPEKLQALNAIIHPEVGKDYDHWVKENNAAPYVIKEAALMFESGSHKRMNKVINISAPEQLRIQRVLKRDPFRSEKEILSIIGKQMPEAERQERSDFIIYNDEKQLLIPQVLDIHRKILQQK